MLFSLTWFGFCEFTWFAYDWVQHLMSLLDFHVMMTGRSVFSSSQFACEVLHMFHLRLIFVLYGFCLWFLDVHSNAGQSHKPTAAIIVTLEREKGQEGGGGCLEREGRGGGERARERERKRERERGNSLNT